LVVGAVVLARLFLMLVLEVLVAAQLQLQANQEALELPTKAIMAVPVTQAETFQPHSMPELAVVLRKLVELMAVAVVVTVLLRLLPALP
jgi:hypothetical protein